MSIEILLSQLDGVRRTGAAPVQNPVTGDWGIRQDIADKIGEETSQGRNDYFAKLGPGILGLPVAVAFGAGALYGEGGLLSGAAATTAESVAGSGVAAVAEPVQSSHDALLGWFNLAKSSRPIERAWRRGRR